jgi:hypothetical protein
VCALAFRSQFPPRSLELFSLHFLRLAPSIQSVDLRENDIGLRGGWSIVDALRSRPAELAPVCEVRVECEEMKDHATSAAMSAAILPQPNIAHTAAAQMIKPAYFDRLQELLATNRLERDVRLLREEDKRKKVKEASKEPTPVVRSALTPPRSSSTRATPSASPSSAIITDRGTSSSPDFISHASFHASLGRLVSELNAERSLRHEREDQLRLARQREQELVDAAELQLKELASVRARFEVQTEQLAKVQSHNRELEAALTTAKQREAALVASHARQEAILLRSAESDRAERGRLASELRAALDAREDDRLCWLRESRSASQLAEAQVRRAGAQHQETLDALERRLDAIRAEREGDEAKKLQARSPNKQVAASNSPSHATSTPSVISSITAADAPRPGVNRSPPTQSTSAVTSTSAPALVAQPAPTAAPAVKKLVLKQRDY